MADVINKMIVIILIACQIYLTSSTNPYCDWGTCKPNEYCCGNNICCPDLNKCKQKICEPGTYCCDINTCCKDYKTVKSVIGLAAVLILLLALIYLLYKYYPTIKTYLLRRQLESSLPYTSWK